MSEIIAIKILILFNRSCRRVWIQWFSPVMEKSGISSVDPKESEGSQIAAKYQDLSLMFPLAVLGICPLVSENI